MANGKVYGTPVGYQPPDPRRVQRAATPATPEQIHAALDAHEQRVRQEYARIQQVRAAVPRPVRGSSAGPKRGTGSVPGIDAAVRKAGG